MTPAAESGNISATCCDSISSLHVVPGPAAFCVLEFLQALKSASVNQMSPLFGAAVWVTVVTSLATRYKLVRCWHSTLWNSVIWASEVVWHMYTLGHLTQKVLLFPENVPTCEHPFQRQVLLKDDGCSFLISVKNSWHFEDFPVTSRIPSERRTFYHNVFVLLLQLLLDAILNVD